MEKDATKGRGKLTAFFDEGSFVETGAYMKNSRSSYAGVVSGYGAVDGRLVFAFAQDSDRDLGAFDNTQAEKICALYRMALENRAPIVGIFDSAGAMVKDGAGVLAAYGKVLSTVCKASGKIPQIALIAGTAVGLSATLTSLFDFVFTIDHVSCLSVGSPFLFGKEIGSAQSVAENGGSSFTASNEEEAFLTIRNLLSYLPASASDGVLLGDDIDDPNRASDIADLTGAALVKSIADGGKFLELSQSFAPELKIGFARIGGESVGILASDATIDGGRLTGNAAAKGTKFIGFCNHFSLPVVTLLDSMGLELAKDAKEHDVAADFSSLAAAYASATVTKVTAIVGKAYGAVFTLLGSKALGADLALAIPTSEIGAMTPASAVAFLWNDRITETCTREMLENEWKTEIASPLSAASDGSIDDVVPPEELRARICSALYMGKGKRRSHCR